MFLLAGYFTGMTAGTNIHSLFIKPFAGISLPSLSFYFYYAAEDCLVSAASKAGTALSSHWDELVAVMSQLSNRPGSLRSASGIHTAVADRDDFRVGGGSDLAS